MSQPRQYRLGKYQVFEEIGRGGMGTVYKGYDPALERHVAIKVLSDLLTGEAEFVQRFLREARAAARLRHPNIVAIYDVGRDGDKYYFVMEYLEGLALNDLIRRHRALPPRRVLAIAQQLAAALDYAHERGLIHRDVKPANIIVGPKGRVTLTDFGIAKVASAGRLTATGTAMGTPEYMAPEQISGREVGSWTDLYSLGVVTYEMLAGQPPFQGETTPAVIFQVVYEAHPPIRKSRSDLPEGVESVISRILSKHPPARYRSGADFVAELEQVLAGKVLPRQRVQARPATVPVEAARAEQEEDWDGVITSLERLLQKDASYPGGQELLTRARRQKYLADLYARAEAAQAQGHWEQAISLLEQLQQADPAYRDVAARLAHLRAGQADRRQAEQKRAQVYRQLRGAVEAKWWTEVIRLTAEIPGYRDADALRAQAEAALAERRRAETYEQLRTASQAERWEETVRLAATIPGYRDADQLGEQASQSLTYRQAQSALSAGEWKRALYLAGQLPPGDRHVRHLRWQALLAGSRAAGGRRQWREALDYAEQALRIFDRQEARALQRRAQAGLAEQRSRRRRFLFGGIALVLLIATVALLGGALGGAGRWGTATPTVAPTAVATTVRPTSVPVILLTATSAATSGPTRPGEETAPADTATVPAAGLTATPTPTPTGTPTARPTGVATAAPTAVPTAPPPTSTPRPPTQPPPTRTPVPPTQPPPTSTPIPPTNTPVPPTDTPRPPTNTAIPPTDTPVPPTITPVPTTPAVPPTRPPTPTPARGS